MENKEAARLISQIFLETYGEKSLSVGYSYLEKWNMDELSKKALADRNYSLAAELRLSGEEKEETIAKYRHALELYTDIGDIRGQAEVLGGLGAVFWYINSDSCLSLYRQALNARIEADDKVLIAATLNGIGGLYFQHFKELDSAIIYYNRAIKVRQKIGDLKGLGNSMIYLALVFEERGQLEEAFRCFEKSYLIHQEIRDRNLMALSKLYAGTNLQKLGRYPEALEDLETARDICLEISDTLNLADVYVQLALVYDNIGDYDTAIDQVSKASGLYQQLGNQWGMAGTYNHTGIILQDADRKKRAEESYLKSLEIYRQLNDQKNVVVLLNNLGTVTFEQNDYESALAYNLQGLELSRSLEYKAGELTCLINLANTQNQLNQLDSALTNYDLALKLSRAMNSPDSEWRTLVGMGENYEIRGDYAKAIRYNEEGLRIIEDLRSTLHSASERSNYLARERYAFEHVIHMLTEQHEKDPGKGYDLLAFEYAQRCKSRSFLEQIKGIKPVTLKQVQNSGLEKKSVIMEYFLGSSSSVLWVITPDSYKMIRLPDHNTLEKQVESLRFALLNPDQDSKSFLHQSGYYLYSKLFQPAEALLSKKSQVMIMPDGILNYIPFEVLIATEPEMDKERPFEKLDYLGKRYCFSYGQSASVYLSMLNPRSSSPETLTDRKEMLAFGNPLYMDKYKQLEFSGEEVYTIATLFPAGSVTLFTEKNATEENAKKENLLSGYRYIHFATHGVIDDEDPLKSGLVLSQDNGSPEDGILSAKEISEMKLNAELVVLSACQTGLGKLVRGEGMIGLSRSLILAGASAVVVSLWSVSDQSTSLLMKQFYKNLTIKRLSVAKSLQQARNLMIRNASYSHPFFWGPFILIGGW